MRRGGRRDDQVVGAPRRPGSTGMGEERAVGVGHDEVVRLDRKGVEYRLDEPPPFLAATPPREVDPDPQLGDGDRGDGDVVVIADQLFQDAPAALGVDQDRGVEDQSRQGSVPGPTLSLRSRSSAAQSESGRFARSASFSALPVPPRAGPIVATARPCRTTT